MGSKGNWLGPLIGVVVALLAGTLIVAVISRRTSSRDAAQLEALAQPAEQPFYAPTSDAGIVRVRLNLQSKEVSLSVAPGTRIEPMFIQEQLRGWDGGAVPHIRPNRESP